MLSSHLLYKSTEIIAVFGVINHWDFQALTFNQEKLEKSKKYYQNLIENHCENSFFIKKEEAQHLPYGYYQNRVAEFHLQTSLLQKDCTKAGVYQYTNLLSIHDLYKIHPSFQDYFLKKFHRLDEGIKSPFYIKKIISYQEHKSGLFHKYNIMKTMYAISHIPFCTYQDLQFSSTPVLETLLKFINFYFATYEKAYLQCETIGYFPGLHLCIIELEIPQQFIQFNGTSDATKSYTYNGPELTKENIKKIHPFYPHYLRHLRGQELPSSAELKKIEESFREGFLPSKNCSLKTAIKTS